MPEENLPDILGLSNSNFVIAIFLCLINSILMVLIAKKFLHIVQLSGYHIRGYSIWLSDTKAKFVSRIALLCFLSLACNLVTNALFDVRYEDRIFYSALGLVFYIYFAIVFILNVAKVPEKMPFVQTRRMQRIMVLLFILSFVISFGLIYLSVNYFSLVRFGILTITAIILPVLVPICHLILIPLEELIRSFYIRKAKKIINERTDLIKIGITGSFGKTSVKYILNQMLGEKYSVCISPNSFNTPMGLTKVVLKFLKPEHNVLICEMGAKAKGDIKFLCNLIKPQHGIITGVGSQHYLTFGSKENIYETKKELVDFIDENGIVVFNGSNDGAKKMFNECKSNDKILVGSDNSDFFAKNVKMTENGVEFVLCVEDNEITCKTSLLGEPALQNILMASAMAFKLGVSLEEIAKVVENIESIRHRMEILESQNPNVVVIDDSFSSNEVGASLALDVLKTFEGRKKIVITPGIVELGSEEDLINREFGKKIAQSSDYVIIVNKVNAESIKEGLYLEKMNSENVFSVDNLEQAKAKLEEIYAENEKYVVLFENDLPDNYI